jgi:hypothetical protein
MPSQETENAVAVFVAPGNALQDQLAALWERVLGTTPIGIDGCNGATFPVPPPFGAWRIRSSHGRSTAG